MEMLASHAEISNNAIRLVEGLTAAQWSNATPCSEWDVRALVNHMAGTSKMLEASASRQTPTHDPEGDLLGDHPVESFTATLRSTEAAWNGDGALDGDVSIPLEMPAIAALGVNILDLGTHCWDLARATGQAHGLSAGTIALIDEWNHQIVSDDVRAGAGFGEILEPADAEPVTEMLAFVGRTA